MSRTASPLVVSPSSISTADFQKPLLWHYTHGLAFPDIIASGDIKLVGHCGRYKVSQPERAVWFSRNQSWEQTVRKSHPIHGHDMTFVQLVKTLGVFRIGVEPSTASISWSDHLRANANAYPDLRFLSKLGKEWGANPKDWYISLQPVEREKWKSVQVYRNWQWIDYTGEPVVTILDAVSSPSSPSLDFIDALCDSDFGFKMAS